MPEDTETTQFQEVRKTMVFGLGTTGVKICRMLAERISEEFGSVSRTPWVRFLCLETNTGEADSQSKTMPIIPISIGEDEYRRNLNDPRTLHNLIQWLDWADLSTLRNIPHITTGAGSIRMAGRLAFLYPDNYSRVTKTLTRIVAELRGLSAVDAKEARGQLRGGANPEVTFAGEGGITYVVVGSLCGGTASGIAVDFGYYLQQYALRDGDKSSKLLAFFTLPRPDLSSALYSDAERYKRNAFCALKEMYHYFQVGRNKYTVKYPDKVQVELSGHPYNLVMLAWPSEGTRDSEEALNRAVAERIFANIFAEGVDPFVRHIDAQASSEYTVGGVTCHSAFCTFGLSVMEYPAHRFADACAYRLAHYAVDRWYRSRAGEPEIMQLLDQIGVTWERLKQDLLTAAGSPEVVLSKVSREAVDETLKSVDSWHNRFGQIELAFGDQTGVMPHPELPFNFVSSKLSQAAKGAAERVVNRLTEVVEHRLLDIDFGTASALRLVEQARQNLQELSQTASVEKPDTQQIDACLSSLRRAQGNRWLKVLFMSGRVSRDYRQPIQNALDEYIQRRIDEVVLGILREDVIPEVAATLDMLAKRLRNLRSRLGGYTAFLKLEADGLAKPPVINGVMPIDEDEADICYQRCLKALDDPVALEKNQGQQAKELLSSWSQLPQLVIALDTDTPFDSQPPTGTPDSVREAIISRDLHTPLLAAARVPFQDLMSVDVLDRWSRHANRVGLLADFVSRSKPFISPDNDRAMELRRGTPLVSRKVAVYPGVGRNPKQAQDFRNELSSKAPDLELPTESPGPTRALLAEDVYCIPIEALNYVTARPGSAIALELAQEAPYETFSRKDVYGWEPVSEGERSRERRCRITLGVAVIAGLAQVQDNKLRVPYQPEHFADADFRYLPPDFDAAVRQWAIRMRDMDGRSLSKLEGLLEAKLAEQCEASGPEGFLQFLVDRLDSSGHGLAGWNRVVAGTVLQEYCEQHAGLRALWRQREPDKSVLSLLRYSQGQVTANDSPADADGYYCINPRCGAFLGASEDDLRSSNWRCTTCGTDYHDMASLRSEWIQQASNRKQGAPA